MNDHREDAVRIIVAYVSNNPVSRSDLPSLIADTFAAVNTLGAPTVAPVVEPAPNLEPAVPVRRSVTPTHIVCLDDGKKFKSLKRHLSALGMTPEAYRTKWGLPKDYPMVAPLYSEQRSGLAKAAGLGRKFAA